MSQSGRLAINAPYREAQTKRCEFAIAVCRFEFNPALQETASCERLN
jgi:hypothetical protein